MGKSIRSRLEWFELFFLNFYSSENSVLHMDDYKIIEKGYKNNCRKRKLDEMNSSLNKQDDSEIY